MDDSTPAPAERHRSLVMSRPAWDRLQAMLQARYFVFRNDGGQVGERMICKVRNPDGSWRGCGRKHTYISSFCIEMPFVGGEGLEEGLWLMFRVAHSDVRKRQILTAISKLPDLGSGHPFTARDLAPKDPGENWLALMISAPEPISRKKAAQLAARINDKRPPQPYCLLDQCVSFLMPNTDCAAGKHRLCAPDSDVMLARQQAVNAESTIVLPDRPINRQETALLVGGRRWVNRPRPPTPRSTLNRVPTSRFG